MKTLISGICALLAVTACGSTSVAVASTPTPSPSAVTSPASLFSCRLAIGGVLASPPQGHPHHHTRPPGHPQQEGEGGFLDPSTRPGHPGGAQGRGPHH